jgi:phosphoenolpyruvate phosphomutase / 2-hydroxyethylphosphonate cytidylyltransferase
MVALCLGSFDGGLHYGHIRFLNQVSLLGEVIVGLGTDDYQAGYKRPPFLRFEERKLALEELGVEVVARDQVSIKPLIESIRPDYLVAGSEWFDGPYLELSGIDIDYLVSQGVALVYLPRNHDMSTTSIVERVRGAS